MSEWERGFEHSLMKASLSPLGLSRSPQGTIFPFSRGEARQRSGTTLNEIGPDATADFSIIVKN